MESVSPPASTTPVPDGGGEALTKEKLEKLEQETADAPAPLPNKIIKGYKNVPSLDYITARMVRTRQLSIDGSSRPPEPEMIEDPKTPGVHIKAPEHPLQFQW